jgi:phospholipid/cholesterol/gamma-HCH transport system substrate-binding protein
MTRARRSAALFALLSLVASACGVFGGNGYTVQAEFPATFNIFPGSPVRVLGLDVGSISKIDVSPDSDVVTVTMHINEDVDIPVDVNAIVIPESLLGERYIQLDPPFARGEVLAAGDTIPVERTQVPFEFDEVLEGLNKFVGGLDEDDVGRLIDNLADILDGQGEQLGRTIDAAHGAIGVLRDNDDDLVTLAGRLADLNETLATRDEQIGEVIQDFSALSRSLADDRFEIDRALNGLLRVTDEVGRLLQVHRTDLEYDLDVLTRVGRTAQRNLDQLSLLILSSAELYRHADRVVDRQTHNWLPLQDHTGELAGQIEDRLLDRVMHLCIGTLGEENCDSGSLEDIIGQVCLPLLPCEEQPGSISLQQALEEIAKTHPELGEELIDVNEQNETGLAPILEEALKLESGVPL